MGPAPPLPDYIIHVVLEVPKDNLKQNTIIYRKFSSINRSEFVDDLQLDYSDINDVDDLVNAFEDITKSAIDKHAPEKTKTVVVRPRNIWYTPEVKQLKREVRRQERRWKSNITEEQWRILKDLKRKYRNLLKKTKSEVLNAEVIESKGNTKRLFQLFNKMTGKNRHNPMPEGRSDQELAESFADFFMNKIQNIRDTLNDIPAYEPTSQASCSLSKFHPLTSEQVKEIIISLSTKSCELDVIP